MSSGGEASSQVAPRWFRSVRISRLLIMLGKVDFRWRRINEFGGRNLPTLP